MVMDLQVPQQMRGFKITHDMVHADIEHGDEPSSSATGEGI